MPCRVAICDRREMPSSVLARFAEEAMRAAGRWKPYAARFELRASEPNAKLAISFDAGDRSIFVLPRERLLRTEPSRMRITGALERAGYFVTRTLRGRVVAGRRALGDARELAIETELLVAILAGRARLEDLPARTVQRVVYPKRPFHRALFDAAARSASWCLDKLEIARLGRLRLQDPRARKAAAWSRVTDTHSETVLETSIMLSDFVRPPNESADHARASLDAALRKRGYDPAEIVQGLSEPELIFTSKSAPTLASLAKERAFIDEVIFGEKVVFGR